MDSLTPEQVIQRVVRLREAGKLSDAESLCRQLLVSQCPNSAVVHHLLGYLNQQLGRHDAAAELMTRAVALNPREPQFAANLGTVLLAAGKPAESILACQRAIALKPDFPEALNNLGNALAASGRFDEAAVAFRQAISQCSTIPEMHNNLGNVLREQSKFDEAIASYQQALALRPDYADAQYNLGMALHRAGRTDEAIDALNAAIKLRPNHAEILNGLGNALMERQQLDQAIPLYRKALALEPLHARAQNNLGAALLQKKDYQEALASYRQALAIDPSFAEAHCNLGLTQQAMGNTDEAIASFRQALGIRANYPDALVYLAASLSAKGLWDEAIAMNRRAIEIKPDFAEGRMSLALLLLSQGRFKEGLPEYEWRRRVKQNRIAREKADGQKWAGENLNGRRIMLYSEQGRGDVIHYVRYVPLIAQRGGKVVLEAYPEFRRLFQNMPGVEQLVDLEEPLPPFDLHCHLPSLPYLFGTTLETIPAPIPYLSADPDLAKHWRDRVSQIGDGVKVGLVWAGSLTHRNNHNRSMYLEDFAPLNQIPGIQFFSLQVGDAANQVGAATNPLEIVDWTNELKDYADTAALIANLDLVISVDTSVAHLAGAMGKKVWVLIAHPSDSRWLLDRRDTPWYPTMRLFRQDLARNWDGPMKSLVSELREFVESKR